MTNSSTNFKELFYTSGKFFFKNFLSFLKLSASALIPLVFFDRFFYMQASLDQIPLAYLNDSTIFFRGTLYTVPAFALLAGSIIIGTVVVLFFYQIALLKMIQSLQNGIRMKVYEYYVQAWKISAAYFLVMALIAFFVSVWSLLLIIPGIIVLFVYSLSVFALFFDGQEGMDALERSKSIIKANPKGFFIPLSLMLTCTSVIYMVLIIIVEIVFQVHVDCKFDIIPVTGEFLQDWVTLIAAAFPLVFLSFLYRDLSAQVKN